MDKKNESITLSGQIEDKVLVLRGQNVLLDSDVARFYDVETKRVNEAVTNNPDMFPEGYVIVTSEDEKYELVENFDRFNKLKHSTVTPTAFTEKGLYMLATILKSKRATQTTLVIIETFAKLREVGRAMVELNDTQSENKKKKISELISVLMGDILNRSLPVEAVETEYNFNLLAVKIKHKVKRGERK